MRTAAPHRADAPGAESGPLAAVMAALWFAGAWQARVLGIWPAVGTAALLLGALALALDRAGLRAALHAGPRQLAAGAVAGLAMAWLTELLFPPVTAAMPALALDVERLYRAFGGPGPRLVLLLLPLVVACEEIVWRGVVYGSLAARLPVAAAVALASLGYAAAHAPIGSPVLVLACLGAGTCWTVLRALTGSLAAVIVAHLAWDLAVLVVRPLVAVP